MLGISFGTRPEWLKIKPVVEELKKRNIKHVLIFTGQHHELMSDVVEDEHWYVLRRLTASPKSRCTRLDGIVSDILADSNFAFTNVTRLMVQGDTSSAYAMALAAFHRGIPVVHLEAGLRTWDLQQPFPEEANRQMISIIADTHLAPTVSAATNLEFEGDKNNVEIVGNTSLDNLVGLKKTNGNKVLITMHRRENHEDMGQWFLALEDLAQKHAAFDFVFPLHPNPNVQKYKDILTSVQVVEPMSHPELLKILVDCKVVVTDSGGLQEESAFLHIPCVVCRKETERPEGLQNFSLLCATPGDLRNAFLDAILKLPMLGDCPYGDGTAAKKVVDALERL
jgi:UDP-N-acetylglucosamine 2-epimerase